MIKLRLKNLAPNKSLRSNMSVGRMKEHISACIFQLQYFSVALEHQKMHRPPFYKAVMPLKHDSIGMTTASKVNRKKDRGMCVDSKSCT